MHNFPAYNSPNCSFDFIKAQSGSYQITIIVQKKEGRTNPQLYLRLFPVMRNKKISDLSPLISIPVINVPGSPGLVLCPFCAI
jgi:hypothetical protein